MANKEGERDWLGERLAGKYELRKELGAGGMGRVFLAMDTSIDRPVAIKVLHRDLADDEEIRRRFEREAKAIARLRHPHCVMLYEFGYSKDLEALYAVFEYVAGFSLEQLVGEQLPLGDVVAVGSQVARAIAHAHDQKIIHRDLKPENIMVVEGTAPPEIKVLDFGIARIAEDDEKRTRLTQMGQMFGTPPYMSPEQARANLDVTHATDIYAIGVILYEMVEGRLPFIGGTPIETVMAHIHDDIPRMERQGLPTDLEGIILTCLQKEASQRFGSCDALARALEAVEIEPSEHSVITDRLAAIEAGEDSDAEARAATLLAHDYDDGDSPDDHGAEDDEETEAETDGPPMVGDEAGEAEDVALETWVDDDGRGRKRWLVAAVLLLLIGGAGAVTWGSGDPEPPVDQDERVEELAQAPVDRDSEGPAGDQTNQDEQLVVTDEEEPSAEEEDPGEETGDDARPVEHGGDEEEKLEMGGGDAIGSPEMVEDEAQERPEVVESEESSQDEEEAPPEESGETPDEESDADDGSQSPEGIGLPGEDDEGSSQPEGIGLPPE